MALVSLMSGTYKNRFFSFSALFYLYLTILQTAKTAFAKYTVLCLIRNLNPTNTLHRKADALDKF